MTALQTTPLIDDDDCSVESEIHWDPSHSEAVICLDDIANLQLTIDTSKTDSQGLCRAPSYKSLFAEASVEVALASSDSVHTSSKKKKKKNRNVARNEKVDASASLKRSHSAGSSGSIKDMLSFGSIHEYRDYESDGSSDEESSAAMSFGTKDDDTIASSADDSVILGILKSSDSKDYIQGGKRMIQTTLNEKKGRSMNDPLLDRFLRNRHSKPAASRAHKHKGSVKKSESADRLKLEGQRRSMNRSWGAKHLANRKTTGRSNDLANAALELIADAEKGALPSNSGLRTTGLPGIQLF